MQKLPHIVIVGAGAGGLELATRLGNKMGRHNTANISLINPDLTHVWKPLWHEVAAGTFNSSEDQLNLVAHAYHHHFRFSLGKVDGLARAEKKVFIAPVSDKKANEQLLPRRSLDYDVLVFAVGSETNSFQTPGVTEHCFFLDEMNSVEKFRQQFLKHFISLQYHPPLLHSQPLTIAIVGGGATGVELAAELHYAALQAEKYGLAPANGQPRLEISIIEAAPSILANLPSSVINLTARELHNRKIKIFSRERVIKATVEGLYTNAGRFIPAQLKIWAAGIKAPQFLQNLAGLEVNSLNQLIVKPTLQTTYDESIFAFGDCAYCIDTKTNRPVPARAQAANQQAKFLVKALQNFFRQQTLPPYHYHDYGSLVSLSENQTVGNLMGRAGGNLFISGRIARLVYLTLYRKHQIVLHGWLRVVLLMIADWLTRRVKPRLKLH